jgi:hypothetical protein
LRQTLLGGFGDKTEASLALGRDNHEASFTSFAERQRLVAEPASFAWNRVGLSRSEAVVFRGHPEAHDAAEPGALTPAAREAGTPQIHGVVELRQKAPPPLHNLQCSSRVFRNEAVCGLAAPPALLPTSYDPGLKSRDPEE